MKLRVKFTGASERLNCQYEWGSCEYWLNGEVQGAMAVETGRGSDESVGASG